MSRQPTPLPRGFYAADAVTVARSLLGCILLATTGDGRWCGGIIVETEAYREEEPASHSFGGPRGRNTVMFGEPGHAYVYTSYGIHACMNAVCGPVGSGEAVLIRALEPLVGLAEQWRRRYPGQPVPEWAGERPARRIRELAAGPGRLTQALGITTALNGADLCAAEAGATAHGVIIAVGQAVQDAAVRQSTRIGISKATQLPWRFTISGNAFPSRPERS